MPIGEAPSTTRAQLSFDVDPDRRCDMAEYYYTTEDRTEQLQDLVAALSRLIECLQSRPRLAPLAPRYQETREKAQNLLLFGFTREQLLELYHETPDIFVRHKEWTPPMVQQKDGSWVAEEWYEELEAALQPTLRAAEKLRAIGYR
jgi:hypothetical protein